ncbi:MAG: NADH-quinone oxidoreductase subunit M [Planctomycetota bacterium]
MSQYLLTLVIFSPLIGVVALLTIGRAAPSTVRRVALGASLLTLFLVLWAAQQFYGSTDLQADGTTRHYFLTEHAPWLAMVGGSESPIDIAYRVGIDGISLWLLVLAGLLMPLAVWSSFTAIKTRTTEYYILLLLLQVGLLGVFCAMDVLLFFVFFEFTLVPLFFLIGIWGGPERKKAAYKFFIYTIAGSVLTFAGIVYLAYFSYQATGTVTLQLEALVQLARDGRIPFNVQWWLFLAFAAGFSIKVPLFPFHTWLPLAHTEAPTAGSVILAGVLLKLGTYGFCRLSIPMLPDAALALAPLLAVLAIIGILYTALAAWVQTDAKKLVAYSSVSHLGFCILGMFSLTMAGLTGSVLYMVNHGLSTGALFLLVGYIYERYHTRSIDEIGGLARRMPWLAFFLVFFTLSSIGLPGLNGFVGEFLVLLGTAISPEQRLARGVGPLGFGYAIPAAGGIILGAVYMLWMCQRILFGPVKEPPHTPDTSAGLTVDLTRREIAIVAPLALACLAIGVYPKPLLNDFEKAISYNILAPTVAGETTENLKQGSPNTWSMATEPQNQWMKIDEKVIHSMGSGTE